MNADVFYVASGVAAAVLVLSVGLIGRAATGRALNVNRRHLKLKLEMKG